MSEPADPNSPPSPLPESRIEHIEDEFADRAAQNPVARGLGSALMPGWNKGVQTLLGDLDAEAAADKAMLDTEERVLAERPTAEAAGVDIAPIKAADPAFEDQLFLSIARESFYHVREARSMDDPRFADAILSPQLMEELSTVMAGDVAAHRHHLLPALEIKTAVITTAAVTDGKMMLTVRFHLSGEQLDRDDKMNIVSGTTDVVEWDEDWAFWRDPSVNADDIDQQHDLAREIDGGWMFAHKGWVVTSITRVGLPDLSSANNL